MSFLSCPHLFPVAGGWLSPTAASALSLEQLGFCKAQTLFISTLLCHLLGPSSSAGLMVESQQGMEVPWNL